MTFKADSRSNSVCVGWPIFRKRMRDVQNKGPIQNTYINTSILRTACLLCSAYSLWTLWVEATFLKLFNIQSGKHVEIQISKLQQMRTYTYIKFCTSQKEIVNMFWWHAGCVIGWRGNEVRKHFNIPDSYWYVVIIKWQPGSKIRTELISFQSQHLTHASLMSAAIIICSAKVARAVRILRDF